MSAGQRTLWGVGIVAAFVLLFAHAIARSPLDRTLVRLLGVLAFVVFGTNVLTVLRKRNPDRTARFAGLRLRAWAPGRTREKNERCERIVRELHCMFRTLGALEVDVPTADIVIDIRDVFPLLPILENGRYTGTVPYGVVVDLTSFTDSRSAVRGVCAKVSAPVRVPSDRLATLLARSIVEHLEPFRPWWGSPTLRWKEPPPEEGIAS